MGINNIVVNPSDVPTTFGEKIRKTDTVDSCKLAKSLRAGILKSIYIPDNEILEIRNLIRLRFSLTKDLTRQKNRIKSFLYFHAIEIPMEYSGTRCWSKRFVEWLKNIDFSTIYGKQSIDIMIAQLENLRLQKLNMIKMLRNLSHSEKYSESIKLITSVPGIGLLTGLAILAEIDNINRFQHPDKLASYIGIVPMCYSSGEHENVGDITMRKHDKLRSLLIEASWIAVRQDPAMTLAYEEYRKKMVPSKAIVKIVRRLVNRIFFVMKNNVMYNNSTI